MLSFLCENKVFTVLLLDCPKCFIIVEYTSIVHFLVLVSTSFLLRCTPSYFFILQKYRSPLFPIEIDLLFLFKISTLYKLSFIHHVCSYKHNLLSYRTSFKQLSRDDFSQVIKARKERAPIESITFHLVKSTS